MHKNIEPSGATILALLLAITILIGLIIQSFVLRNIEDKIDNFSTENLPQYTEQASLVTTDTEYAANYDHNSEDITITENDAEDGISN